MTMTQAEWDTYTPGQRRAYHDTSDLHPTLLPHIGHKVRVTPKRLFGLSTFRVGITTGWKPVLLAMRGNARGSSDIIGATETFTSITRV